LEQKMPRANVVNRPTSLKLPAALKEQLEDVAQSAGMSLHAFMIQTLADSVRRTRLREAFAQDSMAALCDMKTSGLGYELSDVRAHFSQLSSYRKGLQPKPPDLLPSRLG
jgi:predicted transcriptional regulator